MYKEHDRYYVNISACGLDGDEEDMEDLMLLSKYMKEYGEGFDNELGKGVNLKILNLLSEELRPPRSSPHILRWRNF